MKFSNLLFNGGDNEIQCLNKQNRFVRNGSNFCKLGDPGSRYGMWSGVVLCDVWYGVVCGVSCGGVRV